MDSARVSRLLTLMLSPSPLVIAVSVTIVLAVPLLLHLCFFWSANRRSLPTLLLIGPSGAGKTSLLTLMERDGRKSVDTRTSQAPLAVECSLPVDERAASTRFRSTNDPSTQVYKRFLLADTPGHGKLRQYALTSLVGPLCGVIFMIDAAAASGDGLREAAQYLHDVLKIVQKRKSTRSLPILVAANKMDLFTALPDTLLRTALEKELALVMDASSRGLLDSGIGMEETEEDKLLMRDGKVDFDLAPAEIGASIQVRGGHVIGSEHDISHWWSWIGDIL